MHGGHGKPATECRVYRCDPQRDRWLGSGQFRSVSLDLRNLMPEFLQCTSPDGLHDSPTDGMFYVLYLFLLIPQP
jgi:hypothetical protein